MSGPAFPVAKCNDYEKGLTKREYFAAAVWQRLPPGVFYTNESIEDSVKLAYRIADEMIKQSER